MAKRFIHQVVCLTTCRPDYCDTSLTVRAPRLRVKQGRCIRCSYPIQDLYLSRHLRTDAKEKPRVFAGRAFGEAAQVNLEKGIRRRHFTRTTPPCKKPGLCSDIFYLVIHRSANSDHHILNQYTSDARKKNRISPGSLSPSVLRVWVSQPYHTLCASIVFDER